MAARSRFSLSEKLKAGGRGASGTTRARARVWETREFAAVLLTHPQVCAELVQPMPSSPAAL